MDNNYVDYLEIGTKVEISLLRNSSEKVVNKSYVTVIEDIFENNQIRKI